MLNKILIFVFDRLKKLAETLTEPYDLIFIDADKSSYPTYLSLILSLSPPGLPYVLPPFLVSLQTLFPLFSLPLQPHLIFSPLRIRVLKPTGLILADNILRRGLIADSSPANPWSAKIAEKMWKDGDMKALDEFNKMMVQEGGRIETFLMPMFDGLGCGRLVD